ncbi:hypothetical protein NSR00_12230 [Aeribacillus sp. FSL K6-8394]|uniref:hypothetical protein n=1 Tax=Aeribacillus sp. FSL K6-8394 TaxID=2954570 RepID=UPI0030F71225
MLKKGILILSSSAILLTTFVGFEGNKTSAATNEPTTVLPTENDYDALNNEKKELVLDYNSFAKNYQLDPHAAKAAPADDENSSSMYT